MPPFTDQLNNLFIVDVPQNILTPGAPQADWPYFVRQGNCTDPYAIAGHPPSPSAGRKTPAVCSNGLLPNQLMDTRYNDFAPRFGIAYSPDAKTVIRAALENSTSRITAIPRTSIWPVILLSAIRP